MNATHETRRLLIGASTLALLLVAGFAHAAIPHTITTEGLLHAKGGGPVADGTYGFTFSLYATATGGKAVWTEGAKLKVAKGEFHHVLGSTKPLAVATVAGATTLWLGIAIDKDPELPRTRIHAVAYALVAAAAASVPCTGCISLKALKADADLALGGFALSAAKVTAKDVVAGTLSGDGAKITGIAHVSGTCATKGEVVKGIDSSGKLICTKAMDPSALPKDGLDEISNGQLSTEFLDSDKSSAPAPIKDNNPKGVSSSIVVPDRGIAKDVKVSIEVSNSTFVKMKITLKDPAGSTYLLFDNGKVKGGVLKATYPTPTKPLSGDLGKWVGKNPKGKWTLTAIDADYKDNGIDGAIKSWRIDVLTLSNKKVQAPGMIVVGDRLKGAVQLKTASKAPVVCNAANVGYMYVDPKNKTLNVCNGEAFFPLAIAVFGTQKNPGVNCAHILNVHPAAKSGKYWVDPDGLGGDPAWQTVCDMESDGGGWTLFIRHSDPNGKTAIAQSAWDGGMTRAAKGGIKEWMAKTYSQPGESTAAGSKPINAWVMKLAAGVRGSKFTFFKFKPASGCGKHRYVDKGYIDSAKLLPGSQCKAWYGADEGRYLWGEHQWCGRSDRGWMWMSRCATTGNNHILIVNHNYNYPPRYLTMIGSNHAAGKWKNYDEDGGAFEFFFR